MRSKEIGFNPNLAKYRFTDSDSPDEALKIWKKNGNKKLLAIRTNSKGKQLKAGCLKGYIFMDAMLLMPIIYQNLNVSSIEETEKHVKKLFDESAGMDDLFDVKYYSDKDPESDIRYAK